MQLIELLLCLSAETGFSSLSGTHLVRNTWACCYRPSYFRGSLNYVWNHLFSRFDFIWYISESDLFFGQMYQIVLFLFFFFLIENTCEINRVIEFSVSLFKRVVLQTIRMFRGEGQIHLVIRYNWSFHKPPLHFSLIK